MYLQKSHRIETITTTLKKPQNSPIAAVTAADNLLQVPFSRRSLIAEKAFKVSSTSTNVWEPVGEENLYAVIDESSGFVLTDSSGYIIALCDSKGTSKSLVQSLNQEQKDNIVELLKKDNIVEYKGKVALPVQILLIPPIIILR